MPTLSQRELTAVGEQHSTLFGGVMLALLSSFLIASSDMMIKILARELPLFQVMVLQAGFASLPLIGVAVLSSRRKATFSVRNPPLVAARALLAGLGTMAGFYGFSSMPLADFYSIVFFTPIMATVASVILLGERIGRGQAAAVAIGFCAILLMVRPGFRALTPGHMAAFANVAVAAATLLLIRKIGREESRVIMLAAILAGILLIALPGAAMTWRKMSVSHVLMAAAAGALMIAAQFAMLEGLRRAPVSAVAPMQYTMLVWALIYGVLVFGDRTEPHVLVGAALVAGCSIYLLRCSKTQPVPPVSVLQAEPMRGANADDR